MKSGKYGQLPLVMLSIGTEHIELLVLLIEGDRLPVRCFFSFPKLLIDW